MLCKGVLPTSEAFFFFLSLIFDDDQKHESGTHHLLTATSFEARITRGKVHDIGAQVVVKVAWWEKGTSSRTPHSSIHDPCAKNNTGVEHFRHF